MNKILNKLTHKSIKPYGYIIDSACVKDSGKGNSFGILLKERSDGWRIGYLIARENVIRRVEYHDTMETFEPVSGRCAIALATFDAPEKLKLFLLDKPIVLNKGIWHEVAALSNRAEIKIFENIEVDGEYYYLKNEIKVRANVRKI